MSQQLHNLDNLYICFMISSMCSCLSPIGADLSCQNINKGFK